MASEPEEPPFDEEEEGGPVKPFLDHLEDLRWVLIKCVAALIIGMAVSMAAVPYMVAFLKRPLPAQIKLEFLGPLDGFWISMKLSFFGGIILALPYLLYVILDFVVPALKKNERKYVLRALAVGVGLFLGGAALCYFVMLPISLRAMIQYNAWLGIPTTIWRAQEYFSFVSWFMIGMGFAFEMPVVILTLVKLGIIEHSFLVKSRRYVFVINLVVCAFITPDPITTIFMIIPMQILLEVCIWISRYWEKQKRQRETALLAGESDETSSVKSPMDPKPSLVNKLILLALAIICVCLLVLVAQNAARRLSQWSPTGTGEPVALAQAAPTGSNQTTEESDAAQSASAALRKTNETSRSSAQTRVQPAETPNAAPPRPIEAAEPDSPGDQFVISRGGDLTLSWPESFVAHTAGRPISGRVVLTGQPPPETPINAHPACARVRPQPWTTRHYVVGSGGGLANVWVYIANVAGRYHVPTQQVVLDQIGCEFQPYVFALMTKQPLLIRNSDPVLHNITTAASAHPENRFNIAQPKAGKEDVKIFSKSELPLKFMSSVHNWMFAYAGVFDHPFFAVTDGDGRFEIPAGLQPGRYIIAARHLKAGEARQQLVLTEEAEAVALEFVLNVPGDPRSLIHAGSAPGDQNSP